MAGKFARQAEDLTLDLSQLFNRSIRSALMAGLTTALRTTRQDSSNAAAHWLIAAADGNKSRPWQRKFGKLRDLRGTRGRGGNQARKPTPPVGYRRDKGKNRGATLRFVRERELKEVVEKLVHGRRPEGRFYYYHPLLAGLIADGNEVDAEAYTKHAEIETAGQSAVEAAAQVFQRNIAAGRTRKR